MNAMHQDNTNEGATKTSAVEDEMRELIRRQVAPAVSKPSAETAAAHEVSPPLVPSIAASGAHDDRSHRAADRRVAGDARLSQK